MCVYIENRPQCICDDNEHMTNLLMFFSEAPILNNYYMHSFVLYFCIQWRHTYIIIIIIIIILIIVIVIIIIINLFYKA